MKKILGTSFTLLASLVLVACSKPTTASNGGQAETKTETTTSKSSDFAIGDKIVFDKIAEITITKVEWTDERNQFDKSNPEKVLKVTYNITNLSDKDMTIGHDMDLYVGGKKMDTYANTNTIDSISPNRTFEGAVQHFGVNGSGDMEFEVKPMFAFGAKAAIVKFTVN